MKTVDFSETIAACGLKIGRCRQLIEFMKVYEYSRSISFLDLIILIIIIIVIIIIIIISLFKEDHILSKNTLSI